MSEEYLFTQDAGTVSYDSCNIDGITVDDDGTAAFDWNEIPVVEIDEPPHAEAFETDTFYKIPDATVARPIKQPYIENDSVTWLKKPAEELRKMAWSLDNAPYTLGHPDTGMVKRVEDIHGFWKSPHYDSDEERLKEDLYVPTNDSEAKEFVEQNQDVSVGFYNRRAAEYDGDTGDLTDDEVDGFQVDMYGNHIAGVKRGRCSEAEGCGLDEGVQAGKIISETVDDADVGGDGDADENCDPCTKTMTDNDDDSGFDITVKTDDLSLDSLEEQFDRVAELRESYDAATESLNEIREDFDEHDFDVDADECPCETVEEVLHSHDDLENELGEVREELDGYRAEEVDEALDELVELNADRDQWEDADLDEIREEIDRREEVLDGIDTTTKGAGSGAEETTDEDDTEKTLSGRRTFGRGHNA